MAFRNLVFDEEISEGAKGGPMYHTTVLKYNNGFEQRNIDWDEPLNTWDVTHLLDTTERRSYFLRFWRNTRGMGHSWLFKDWSDYICRSTASTIPAPYNEGTVAMIDSTHFQAQKRYYDGLDSDYRPIFHFKNGTIHVFDNTDSELVVGTEVTIDNDTGVFVKIGSKTPSYWVGEFYYEARFDVDNVDFTGLNAIVWEWSGIKVREVRPAA